MIAPDTYLYTDPPDAAAQGAMDFEKIGKYQIVGKIGQGATRVRRAATLVKGRTQSASRAPGSSRQTDPPSRSLRVYEECFAKAHGWPRADGTLAAE